MTVDRRAKARRLGANEVTNHNRNDESKEFNENEDNDKVVDDDIDDEECDDDEDDEDDEEEEDNDEGPPQKRVVPERSTRGMRFTDVVGEAALVDNTFWNHNTWQDDREDEEWSTEDEGRYKDIFETDFDEESDESEEEEERVEGDEKKTKKKNVYIDPRKDGRVTSKNKHQGGPKILSQPRRRQLPWSVCKPGGPKYRQPKQSDHLAVAARTEKINTASLTHHEEQENHKRMLKAQTQTVWKGKMECYISWASDRLIEAEESKKAARRKRQQTIEDDASQDDEIYCRELLFFIDFSEPQNSCVPPIYTQLPAKKVEPKICGVTGLPAKYYDPVTNKYYANQEAFRIRRFKYHRQSRHSTMNSLTAITKKMDSMSKALTMSTEQEQNARDADV